MQKTIPRLSAGALERFVVRARRAAQLQGTVNILITSSNAMRALNRQFRSKNKATDVLSFPADMSGGRASRNLAGEVAVSAEIAMQNAGRLGHSAAEEVKILALHGILHLAGFDHERDNGEMARKEAKLRQALRLPAALIERSHSVTEKRQELLPPKTRRSR